MPGFGFGFGSRGHRQAGGSTPPPEIAGLAPDPAWTGIAGSGFAEVPADPVRTTAKPAVQLLTPDRQRFTDSYVVGVMAGANDNGSLMETMGVEKVIFHYEGASVEVTDPHFRTFEDANGNPVTYYGWWAELQHNGTHGEAHLYVEAVPRDATMQKRVTGPHRFLPNSVLYDVELEIAPSQPEIAGLRYQTIGKAGFYCRSNSIKFPRFTFTEGDEHIFDSVLWGYYHNGVFAVEATVPITLTLDSAPFLTGVGNPYFDPKTSAFRFSGANITIEFQYAKEFYIFSSQPIFLWFDGVNIINSAGNYSLFQKRPRNDVVFLFRGGNTWLTECYFEAMWQAGVDARLARGCTFHQCWSDLFNHCDCVVGNRVTDFDVGTYRADIDALDVHYTGAEATATLAISVSNLVTLTWGPNSATLQLSTLDPFSGAYTVQELANWIETHAGFSANVLDDSRAAFALGLPGGVGTAFGPLDVKSALLSLTTAFDIHADWNQQQDTGSVFTENMIVYANKSTGMVDVQDIFFGGTPGVKDIIILNNAFHNVEPGVLASQFRKQESHMVLAHNSFATQAVFLREDLTGDQYSLFANNVTKHLYSFTASPDPDIVYTGNHAQESKPNTPSGTTIGGSAASLFADAANGDFTPQGELLVNPKTSVVRYDLNGAQRGLSAPAGAVR